MTHTQPHGMDSLLELYKYNASCRFLMLAVIIIFMTSESARKMSTQFHDTQLHELRARKYANYMYVWYNYVWMSSVRYSLRTTEHPFLTSTNQANAFLIRHHTFQTSDWGASTISLCYDYKSLLWLLLARLCWNFIHVCLYLFLGFVFFSFFILVF